MYSYILFSLSFTHTLSFTITSLSKSPIDNTSERIDLEDNEDSNCEKDLHQNPQQRCAPILRSATRLTRCTFANLR